MSNLEKTFNSKINGRQRSDRSLKIFLVILVVGYIFFFTSNFTMPKTYRNVVPTEMSTDLGMDKCEVTIDAWDYCKKTRTMLAIFEITNLTLDENPNIEFIGRSGESIYKSEIINRTGNYYAVKFWDIPRRWSTASITVTVDDATGKAQTTDKAVNNVDKIKENWTDKEIIIHATEGKIDGLENLVTNCKKEKRQIQKQLDYSVEKIEELEEKLRTETEEEKAKTQDDINAVSSEAENLQGEYQEISVKEQEYREKIVILQQYLSEIKRG